MRKIGLGEGGGGCLGKMGLREGEVGGWRKDGVK